MRVIGRVGLSLARRKTVGRASDRGRAATQAVRTGVACLAALLLVAAAGPASSGDSLTSLRRLSQDQYRQRISDIFGSDIRISGRLEPDPRRDGLIAIGLANAAVGAAGFEQYDAAAREIALQVTDKDHRATSIGCTPQDPVKADDACADVFVSRVGRLLFRRSLQKDEIGKYVALASRVATQKRDFHDGLAFALTTMLEAPPFLFRMERAVRENGIYRLDDFSIASRLSFMIWNGPPDEALLAAAEQAELRNNAGIDRQVDRMLASVRFERGARAFFSDMLVLDDLNGLQKDPAIYPRFSNRLAADAREQTLRTIVDMLVRRDLDYRALFTTRETFLSRSLGLLYSEPVTVPVGWERHEFAADDPRVGILSQPAFLMSHSHPGRSSPTLRGKAIRELILCQKVPAPPPNVNFAIVQNVKDPRYSTARQRIAAHNTEPMCAACHKMMDPLGLPLEGFDGAAGMRGTENGAELDLSGMLGAAKFAGPGGLGQTLADDPALSSCLINRLYAYGTGKAPDGEASTWTEALRVRFAVNGLRLRDLIKAMVLNEQFYRAGPAAPRKHVAVAGGTLIGQEGHNES